jgi:hypothetical protein
MKKKQETETPLMKTTTKLVGGLIALVVLLPALIRSVSQLLLPVSVLVVLLLVGRVVWFHTRM